MERADTPFFVEKNLPNRHGLCLIQGSGEEPLDWESRRIARQGQYMETVIKLFLTESGLDDVNLDKSNINVGLLEEEFNNFIESEKEDASSEEQIFLESMTFSGVAHMCEVYAQGCRETVRSLPLDAPQEIRESAFRAARLSAQINMIMQEAVSMTATQKAASRNIVIVQPDENPTESS